MNRDIHDGRFQTNDILLAAQQYLVFLGKEKTKLDNITNDDDAASHGAAFLLVEKD